MRKYEYSKDLVNCVKQFLVDDDWHFSFDENTGVFDFRLRVKSKIQKINYIIDVHEDEVIVYGMCPIGADHTDSNMMAQMAEFLCRANYGLKNGCFELDFRDGEIRFKSFIDCDNVLPSTEVIKNSIHCTAAMYDRYAPGILDIIFSGCTGKEAIAKCEKSPEDELRSLITETVGDGMDSSDVADMLERLATRLGIKEGEEDESDAGSENTDTSEEILVNLFDGKKEGGDA